MPPNLDPAFLSLPPSTLRVPDDAPARPTAVWLARRIGRTPLDLHSHLRRIHLHADQNEPELLAAALADLCIALGERGQRLRERLLQRYSTQLSAPWRDVLTTDTPLTPHTPLPMNGGWCRLSAGCEHNAASAVQRHATQAPQRALIDEIRDLIDGGQLEKALALLEEAVREPNAAAALHEELIALYRALRQSERMRHTAAALPTRSEPILQLWRNAGAFAATPES